MTAWPYYTVFVENRHIMAREKMLSFRLSDDEFDRLAIVVKSIQKRAPYAKMADIYREIFGVVNTGIVTDSDRAIIAGHVRPMAQPDSVYLMSTGTGKAPTERERQASQPDIRKARELARKSKQR